MSKLFILLWLLLYSHAAFSQAKDSVQHEAAAHAAGGTATDTIRYYINYAATGIINKANNVNSYVLSNAVKFSVSKKSVVANANAGWIYGEQDGNLTNNDFSVGMDFNLYKSLRHFYYWGLAGYTTSYSLKINRQLQAGLGPGYNVIDKKTVLLIISDGLLYEKGDLYDVLYDVNGTDIYQRDVYQTVRNSFRVRFRWAIKDIVVIEGTAFFQHSLDYIKDYIVKSSQSLSFKLNRWISITTSLAYNKFNRTGSENLLLNFGISIDKHF